MAANAVRYIAEEYGVHYIDFVSQDDTVDYAVDCMDAHGHLNASGARKVTDYLGRYITEHYDVEDRRSQAGWLDWDEDMAVYMRNKESLLRAQGSGRMVVFSSVAGVRVRRANYVYGSAKAGLDGFASGLADALHGSGVSLLLVRPGFVIGRMTEGMSPAPFSSTPPQVADAVVRALGRGRGEVWVPALLRPVFFGMRLLPRAIWRRLPR